MARGLVNSPQCIDPGILQAAKKLVFYKATYKLSRAYNGGFSYIWLMFVL